MPKALVLVDGRPFYEHQLRSYARAGGQRCCVVLGHHLEAHLAQPLLRRALAGQGAWGPLEIEVAINGEPERGMRSSIDTALAQLGAGPAFVLPVDCPAPSAVFGRLLAAGPSVVPTVRDRGRHPVLLSAEVVTALSRTDAPLDQVLGPYATRVAADDLGPLDNLNRSIDWRAHYGSRVSFPSQGLLQGSGVSWAGQHSSASPRGPSMPAPPCTQTMPDS